MRYTIIAEKRGDSSSRMSGPSEACSLALQRAFAAYLARKYPSHVVYLEREG